MKGLNAKFRSDPAEFLRTAGYEVPGATRSTNVGSFAGIAAAAVVEFDLVPGKGRFADLKVLGPVGTYGATRRFGAPIVGHFLHWNGQTFASGPASFGSLDLSACQADYVFTAPFTGCHFVVTQNNGGAKTLYHEPTEGGGATYADAEIARIGPDYTTGLSGNGVLVRRTGGWRAIVSTMGFGDAAATVETLDF